MRVRPLEAMTASSRVAVHVPMPLRRYVAGAGELAVVAATLRGVLEELERLHPALHRCICDETGAVRRHINLFVNTQHMRDLNGLETSVGSGDLVIILPAVSGG